MTASALKSGTVTSTQNNPYMDKVLNVLRRDHSNFENLLTVMTHVADLLAEGEAVNVDIIRAGAVYYKGYVAAFHHPIEDLLYGHLRMKSPATVVRIFPVAEDHRHYGDWVLDLLRAMQNYLKHKPLAPKSGRRLRAEGEKLARENFCITIRGFVSHMRSHMVNEKPLFQLAMQLLDEQDWKAISRSIVADADPLFDNRRPRYERLLRAVLAADESARSRLLLKKW